MSKIKVIEGMEPDEVMRAHRVEGKRIAQDYKGGTDWSEIYYEPLWNWAKCDYAVIDDSQPEIDWDGFDWDFFNQYGGLPFESKFAEDMDGSKTKLLANSALDISDYGLTSLRPSPFYHWPGGKQPVPDNVEVEIKYIAIYSEIHSKIITTTIKACDIEWEHGIAENLDGDVIAFRLTGRVL